jgi:hypothetical protein
MLRGGGLKVMCERREIGLQGAPHAFFYGLN